MAGGEIVVVGAGVVGLTTALGLAAAGVPVTVVESRPRARTGSEDVTYHWSTLPGLDRLGVLDDALGAGVRVDRWSFKVFRTGELLIFDLGLLADETPHPHNLHLEKSAMSEILLAHLASYPHARVEFGTEVIGISQDPTGVEVTANGPEGATVRRCGWLVGADGAHSRVRRDLGLGFAGMTWSERLVAVDLDIDLATLGFSPAGFQLDTQHGALVAQLDRVGHWRYVFGESMHLPGDTVDGRIPAALKGLLAEGPPPIPLNWSAHRVHERAAQRYRVGRVLLAGDAAHVTNPTSSLGLASGLFDSFGLAERLAEVVVDGAPDSRLDDWARDRQRIFTSVASPLSAESMQLVFQTRDETSLEAEADYYRRIVDDRDRQREYLLLSRSLESGIVL